MALIQSCKRQREGRLSWESLAAKGVVYPGRGPTFVVNKRAGGGGNLRKVSTWARQMQPHTIPLSPAMWFGGQDDRLIGLGYLGQAAFIWEVSVGQGPHWCAHVIWARAAGDLGPPPPLGSFWRGAG